MRTLYGGHISPPNDVRIGYSLHTLHVLRPPFDVRIGYSIHTLHETTKVNFQFLNIRGRAECKNHNALVHIIRGYAPLNFVSSSFCDKIMVTL